MRNITEKKYPLVNVDVVEDAYSQYFTKDNQSMTVPVDHGRATVIGDREITQTEYPSFMSGAQPSTLGTAGTIDATVLQFEHFTYGIYSIVGNPTNKNGKIEVRSKVAKNNFLKALATWREITNLQDAEDNPFLNSSAVQYTDEDKNTLAYSDGKWTNGVTGIDTKGISLEPQLVILREYFRQQAQFLNAFITFSQILSGEAQFKFKFQHVRERIKSCYEVFKRSKYIRAFNEMANLMSNDWFDFLTYNKYIKPLSIISSQSSGPDTPLEYGYIHEMVSIDDTIFTKANIPTHAKLHFAHLSTLAAEANTTENYTLPLLGETIQQIVSRIVTFMITPTETMIKNDIRTTLTNAMDSLVMCLDKWTGQWRSALRSVRVALKYATMYQIPMNWAQGYTPPEIRSPKFANFTLFRDIMFVSAMGSPKVTDSGNLSVAIPTHRGTKVYPHLTELNTGGAMFLTPARNITETMLMLAISGVTIYFKPEADKPSTYQYISPKITNGIWDISFSSSETFNAQTFRGLQRMTEVLPYFEINVKIGEVTNKLTMINTRLCFTETWVVPGFLEYLYTESLLQAPIKQA